MTEKQQKQIDAIEHSIQPLRNQLTNHQLYNSLTTVNDVATFMHSHVYAVWDFMSLLKALQTQLTTTTLPWKPVQTPKTARFINEIVLGEETDVNELGEPKSHYEMYLDAMQEVDAPINDIEAFVHNLNHLEHIQSDIKAQNLPKAIEQFLSFTFKVILTNEAHKIASAFTFGREDVIPDMFIEIVKQAEQNGKAYPKLMYYLERHIELDGDEHGPLSLEMIAELCGDNQQKWDEATTVAQQALQYRIALWDYIQSTMSKN